MLTILLKLVIPFLVIFQLLPLLIWLERKGSAYIQDRTGPNRAQIAGVRLGGLVHSLADVIKLLFKEDIIPSHVNKPFYIAAPIVALFVASITFLVIPFADTVQLGTLTFEMIPVNLNVGILYILAMSSLGVYGVMLAGWSSNNKYALLGGVRSSAQMISYELSMGLAILSVIMMSGSLELGQIVLDQSSAVWKWNFIVQPLACLIFVVASFAETNRAPFDLPEGESELVAGFHVEYSSIKFAMFFMAEYVHMIIASALIVTMFFGGWQVPFASTSFLRDNAHQVLKSVLLGTGVFSVVAGLFLLTKFKRVFKDKRDFEVIILGLPAVLVGCALVGMVVFKSVPDLSLLGQQILVAGLQVMTFLFKILCVCWFFIWVRWTLPRFRYDQLMNLGWKCMLPLSVLNLVITAVVMWFRST